MSKHEQIVGWRSGDTAPRDGSVFLAIYRDNGLDVYALTHWRNDRDGTSGWHDGTEASDKAPRHWMPLPAVPCRSSARRSKTKPAPDTRPLCPVCYWWREGDICAHHGCPGRALR